MAGDDSTYDDVETITPQGPGVTVVNQQQPVQDIGRAEGYIKQHQANADRYRVNFEDLMKQRSDAVKAAGDQLTQTINELRDRHEGRNGGINLPLLMLGAGMLAKTGDFGTKLGAGLTAMGEQVGRQRMSDDQFFRGIADLQMRQAQLADVPMKDAAALARQGQLKEEGNASAIEKAIITSKADRPTSLGGGFFYDPKRDAVVNGFTGQVMMGEGVKAGSTGPDALIGSDTHGDEFLKNIPDPSMRQFIKDVGNYKLPFTISGGIRSPMAQQWGAHLEAMISQYNPDWNAGQFPLMQQVKKDMLPGGKIATTTASAAKTMMHLAGLQDAAAGLFNGNFPKWNNIANLIEQNKGDGRVKEFQAAREIVGTELDKFLAGHTSVTGIENWKDAINQADSPEALQRVITRIYDAMNAQLKVNAAQVGRALNKHDMTPDDLVGDPQSEVGLKPDDFKKLRQHVLNNDITTEGGRFAVLRRGENERNELAGREKMPEPSSAQWEQGIAILRKHPTPENQANFDKYFGKGAAKRVLGNK